MDWLPFSAGGVLWGISPLRAYDTIIGAKRKTGGTDIDYRGIITVEPGKRSGQPCIRGMRITVYDVLGYLAAGMTYEEVLEDFPELTREDILACLAFAADGARPFHVR